MVPNCDIQTLPETQLSVSQLSPLFFLCSLSVVLNYFPWLFLCVAFSCSRQTATRNRNSKPQLDFSESPTHEYVCSAFPPFSFLGVGDPPVGGVGTETPRYEGTGPTRRRRYVTILSTAQKFSGLETKP